MRVASTHTRNVQRDVRGAVVDDSGSIGVEGVGRGNGHQRNRIEEVELVGLRCLHGQHSDIIGEVHVDCAQASNSSRANAVNKKVGRDSFKIR